MRPRRRYEPARPSVPHARINDGIRTPRVRLIDTDGSQIGIKTTDEAREYAYAKNLDLVEIAATADPPVCRVMDYGKYRYGEEQKAKLARKHQQQIHIKEIKLRPKIGVHDYETKKGHVVRFLHQRAKVKVTIMFRGRETTHPERGRDLLMRLAEDVQEIGMIESQPLLEGRNMTMVLAPTKSAGEKAKVVPEVKAEPEEKISKSAEEKAKAEPEEKISKSAEEKAKAEPEAKSKSPVTSEQ
ncbi:MAG TPA: translation initiation factor IF-3, partial [Gaiellaceae bacterium]